MPWGTHSLSVVCHLERAKPGPLGLVPCLIEHEEHGVSLRRAEF